MLDGGDAKPIIAVLPRHFVEEISYDVNPESPGLPLLERLVDVDRLKLVRVERPDAKLGDDNRQPTGLAKQTNVDTILSVLPVLDRVREELLDGQPRGHGRLIADVNIGDEGVHETQQAFQLGDVPAASSLGARRPVVWRLHPSSAARDGSASVLRGPELQRQGPRTATVLGDAMNGTPPSRKRSAADCPLS